MLTKYSKFSGRCCILISGLIYVLEGGGGWEELPPPVASDCTNDSRSSQDHEWGVVNKAIEMFMGIF